MSVSLNLIVGLELRAIVETYIPELVVLALGFAAISVLITLITLMFSYRFMRTVKSMSSLSQYTLNTDVPKDLVKALKQHDVPPTPLSDEQAHALWTLVRTALFDAPPLNEKTGRANRNVGGPEEPGQDELRVFGVKTNVDSPSYLDKRGAVRDAEPRRVKAVETPSVRMKSVSRELPQKVARESQERHTPPAQTLPSGGNDEVNRVVLNLSGLGLAGMNAMSSRGEFARFQQRNDVKFFNLDNTGLRTQETRIPAAERWAFSLTDIDSGLSALFLGPAVRSNGQRMSSNAREEAKRFEPWFNVTIKGNKPNLVKPAIIKLVNNQPNLIQKGEMTI
ncbi:MAG: hypothetical protein ACSHXY_06035 [Alphaproteobacteria bacterium]